MVIKDLLNAMHDVVHKAVHIALIPVVAVLEGAIALLTRFLTELQKI